MKQRQFLFCDAFTQGYSFYIVYISLLEYTVLLLLFRVARLLLKRDRVHYLIHRSMPFFDKGKMWEKTTSCCSNVVLQRSHGLFSRCEKTCFQTFVVMIWIFFWVKIIIVLQKWLSPLFINDIAVKLSVKIVFVFFYTILNHPTSIMSVIK